MMPGLFDVFADGGPVMLVLASMAVVHALLCVAQLMWARTTDLLPALWAGVGAILLAGLLGTVLGWVTTYDEVARASLEQKELLLAQGTAAALSSMGGALMWATGAVLLTGAVHSVVRTLRLQRPA